MHWERNCFQFQSDKEDLGFISCSSGLLMHNTVWRQTDKKHTFEMLSHEESHLLTVYYELFWRTFDIEEGGYKPLWKNAVAVHCRVQNDYHNYVPKYLLWEYYGSTISQEQHGITKVRINWGSMTCWGLHLLIRDECSYFSFILSTCALSYTGSNLEAITTCELCKEKLHLNIENFDINELYRSHERVSVSTQYVYNKAHCSDFPYF